MSRPITHNKNFTPSYQFRLNAHPCSTTVQGFEAIFTMTT